MPAVHLAVYFVSLAWDAWMSKRTTRKTDKQTTCGKVRVMPSISPSYPVPHYPKKKEKAWSP